MDIVGIGDEVRNVVNAGNSVRAHKVELFRAGEYRGFSAVLNEYAFDHTIFVTLYSSTGFDRYAVDADERKIRHELFRLLDQFGTADNEELGNQTPAQQDRGAALQGGESGRGGYAVRDECGF